MSGSHQTHRKGQGGTSLSGKVSLGDAVPWQPRSMQEPLLAQWEHSWQGGSSPHHSCGCSPGPSLSAWHGVPLKSVTWGLRKNSSWICLCLFSSPGRICCLRCSTEQEVWREGLWHVAHYDLGMLCWVAAQLFRVGLLALSCSKHSLCWTGICKIPFLSTFFSNYFCFPPLPPLCARSMLSSADWELAAGFQYFVRTGIAQSLRQGQKPSDLSSGFLRGEIREDFAEMTLKWRIVVCLF